MITKIGDTWFSPVGYACILAAFIVLGLSISLIPVYMVCYFKARWQRNLVLRESSLTTFARRLRDAEAASASEQEVVACLRALPTERWQDREITNGQPKTEECCLCLERFLDEDMVRVLPCSHFFHQACVDDWFSARSFLPRTCPLCKRNPVAAQTLPGAVVGDDAHAESVRQTDNRPGGNIGHRCTVHLGSATTCLVALRPCRLSLKFHIGLSTAWLG